MHLIGFTLVELAITVAIIGTLTTLAIPSYVNSLNNAKITRAIGDIRAVEKDIAAYEADHGETPATLGAIGRGSLLDPWENPYQFMKFTDQNKGAMRKDRFLVPLNTSYDLYSKGKDGKSIPPLTANVSWDDIIRANDGAYVGLASGY
ncbi:MAG: prepilin-type N-terminal cleavage/methylation domain-containing protein [Candidatus Latescibacteria bacterium]|nr:prepilin-type N-terminal cleavage/methylation domain-containing protein [Candidatus Latescibacterota bacterium]NIO01051.1 prepilin-type N-terminal cleavage/methylation domain-containing protein [Candidatus Latescibacterota bacterium]NIO27450.1 prepilin-type N-terminal cleavage/methylation domain-containing protein [Candidatus Latescibacterota bacterium]NIO54972.1 prepilin-type N-terminal cleavage/methylation domain-containing protein [Candidatus Latescibacterota bacterium]NIT01061.1 prepilin